MRATVLPALTVTVAMLLSGCGDAADEPEVGGATTTAGDTATTMDGADTTDDGDTTDGEVGQEATTLATADTELGTILVDGEGRTVYVFDNDADGESACTGGCAENWPPLAGPATAASGVDGSLLGTTTRDDGSVQVTYAGSPLYHFASDTEPGQVNGQGVGDVWWVVAPDGTKVTGDGDGDKADNASGYGG